MTSDTADTTDNEFGRMVTDRYQVIRPLGQGGMGIVYEAWDRFLRRRVALKLIRRETTQEAAAAARLVREAQVMAALEHDHVVSAYDVGTWNGRVFIAMQMIAGTTMRHWMTAAPRTDLDKLRVLIGAGRGLAAAHARNIVHRDFKPDNVLVDSRGIARVTDFGIARQLDCTEPEVAISVDPLGDTQLTQSGAMLGTPAYMAPEQSLGGTVTARADQYSFCVTAWELFAGRRPFTGATATEVLANKLAGTVQPASTSKWPDGLEELLRRGFCVDPTGRYASLDVLLTELEQLTLAPPPRGGHIMRLAAVIGVTASAAGLAIVLATSSSASAHTPAPVATPVAPAPTTIQVEAIELPEPAPVAAVAPTEPPRAAPTRAPRKTRTKSAAPRAIAETTAPAEETPVVAPPAPEAAPAPPPPAAPDPAQVRAAIERDLDAVDVSRTERHLLVVDIPGYGSTRDAALAAAARGDSGAATDQVALLRTKIAAVRIDKKFVETKAALLSKRAETVQLDATQAPALHHRLTSAANAAAADQHEVANRHLTALGKLLGLR